MTAGGSAKYTAAGPSSSASIRPSTPGFVTSPARYVVAAATSSRSRLPASFAAALASPNTLPTRSRHAWPPESAASAPASTRPGTRPVPISPARPGSSRRPVRSPEAPRMSRVFTRKVSAAATMSTLPPLRPVVCPSLLGLDVESSGRRPHADTPSERSALHVFNSLSDRLTATFKNLRGKGRLTEADVDGTVREIRRALLDADVAVPVVREFTAHVKERALSEEVSQALNPGQQVVKIVNEEFVRILGGETRRINLAKNPPTVIMLAGLQGAGKTTLAGKLAKWLKGQGHTPLLVACDLQRPNAVKQLQVNGERAGVPVYAPHPGVSSEFEAATGDPVVVARDGVPRPARSSTTSSSSTPPAASASTRR